MNFLARSGRRPYAVHPPVPGYAPIMEEGAWGTCWGDSELGGRCRRPAATEFGLCETCRRRLGLETWPP